MCGDADLGFANGDVRIMCPVDRGNRGALGSVEYPIMDTELCSLDLGELLRLDVAAQ